MTGSAPLRVLRETVRVERRRLPLWRYHRERLAEAGVATPALAAIEAAVTGAAAAAPPATVKLHVVVSPDGRFAVDLSSDPSSLAVAGGPVLVPVIVGALPDLPPRAAKPADRVYWDGPMRLAHLRGGHQAVLVTPDGQVIDGGTATVWAVIAGTLVTTPAPPAVAGVARRAVLREVAAAASARTQVRPLQVEELLAADEVLLSNAVGGVVGARGRAGRFAAEVAREFEVLVTNGCGSKGEPSATI